MTDIAIFGAGGHGLSVASAVREAGNTAVFFDDRMPENTSLKPNIIGDFRQFLLFHKKFVAIGNNQLRQRLCHKADFDIEVIRHPACWISQDVHLKSGTVVLAGAVINAACDIGQGAIINSGAIIEHGCHLGDFSHVSPGATLCGDVSVGKFSWVGAGAVIKEGVSIGQNVTIGAGSVVLKDTPDNSVLVGNPAKLKVDHE